MKIEDVKRKERKTVSISIRTYPSYSKFMRDKEISPNAIFDRALKELMKK